MEIGTKYIDKHQTFDDVANCPLCEVIVSVQLWKDIVSVIILYGVVECPLLRGF